MQQASDFLAESEALEQLIQPLQASDFARPTGFKSWTFEKILRHLHFWNHMANLALTAPDDFQAALKPAVEAMMAGKTLPEIEIVAFNAGLNMLRTDKSPVIDRIKSMAESIPDITFSACGNTIAGITKKEGTAPPLTSYARVVPGGVGRLMALDDSGYYVVRP